MIKNKKLFMGIMSNIIIATFVIFTFLPFWGFEKSETKEAANSEFNGAIYAGDKASNNVSLMVNVYWGNEHLEKMLDIFKKHGIKTTFFVGGTWASENEKLLRRIFDNGHEIASHGFKHKDQGKLSYTDNLTEIQVCHEIVKTKLGLEMELFAPPSGSYNSNTIKAAEFLGYKTIMWTKDTIDWRDHDTKVIYNRAVTNMSGGDLVLMHPTKNTAEALESIIEYAKNHNFNLVSVSKTLGFDVG
ncbi:MAG: polysaccharide deacetylase [Clostridiales bacterium]|nr:polysaccharide deacetylase [Clostridiales bacterium]